MSQVASGCHSPRARACLAKNPTVNAAWFSRIESVPGKANRANALNRNPRSGFFLIVYVTMRHHSVLISSLYRRLDAVERRNTRPVAYVRNSTYARMYVCMCVCVYGKSLGDISDIYFFSNCIVKVSMVPAET